MQTALIGIDWGTTRLRGFRIGDAGALLEQRESPLGISAMEKRQFDQALRTLIADWQPGPGRIPIVMCGMIGSRQGWREVAYSACPAGLGDLLQGMETIDTSCGPACIAGGLTATDSHGDYDVMRGEEVQMLGLCDDDRRMVIAPGTHSKWAVVERGRIEGFRTYMTGEIYGLLRRHSTLGWLLAAAPDEVQTEPFLDGVRRSLADPDLLNLLFAVRTRGLFAQQTATALSSTLSGLLIGSELAGGMRQHAELPVTVLASPSLGQLYTLALSAAGRSDIRTADADQATAHGLWKLWRLIGGRPGA